MKDFFSKWDQIRRTLRIWSNLLKKFLMEIFISVQCLAIEEKGEELQNLFPSKRNTAEELTTTTAQTALDFLV